MRIRCLWLALPGHRSVVAAVLALPLLLVGCGQPAEPLLLADRPAGDPARVDHRADIYGLGAILYRALTDAIGLPRRWPPSASA